MKVRVVLDTNLIVSYLMNANTVPGSAITLALLECEILTSDAMLDELRDVLSRPKFMRYFSRSIVTDFLSMWVSEVESVEVIEPVRICRDPRDDKFLEAAAGNANYLVTGDKDLLHLYHFRGVRILTPAQFLSAMRQLEG